MIEVFKVEESGYGDILSPAFVEWRNGEDTNKAGIEAAKARMIGLINH